MNTYKECLIANKFIITKHLALYYFKNMTILIAIIFI